MDFELEESMHREQNPRSGFLNAQLTQNIVDKNIVGLTCILLTRAPMHTPPHMLPKLHLQAPCLTTPQSL